MQWDNWFSTHSVGNFLICLQIKLLGEVLQSKIYNSFMKESVETSKLIFTWRIIWFLHYSVWELWDIESKVSNHNNAWTDSYLFQVVFFQFMRYFVVERELLSQNCFVCVAFPNFGYLKFRISDQFWKTDICLNFLLKQMNSKNIFPMSKQKYNSALNLTTLTKLLKVCYAICRFLIGIYSYEHFDW